MANVTVRDLRNRGGEVIDRVLAGESMTITRDGTPVADLRPLRRRALDAETLLEHWRSLPVVDGDRMRREIDTVLDPSL